MDTTRHVERLERVRAVLATSDAEWLLLPASADFRWLSGAHARSSERLLVLAVPRLGDPFCLVPKLEADALAIECPWLEQEVWEDHEPAYDRLARRLDLARRPSLLLGEGFRTTPLLMLSAAAACRPAAPALEPLRASKDAGELRALEEAGRHADRIVQEAAERLRPGVTEREVGRFVLERFEALGDTDPWALIASGPNSALPHHSSSSRRIEDGDVVIVDVGAYTDGYGSDITRTFYVGTPPAEAERVYDAVDRARRAGIAAVRAGVAAGDVDRAARAVIEEAGYGPAFKHRTGHGVGLEVHEPPYIVAGSRIPLAAGNVHSVEPGIYLDGRFGVRLEDLVVVEPGAARRLNDAPFAPRTEGVGGGARR